MRSSLFLLALATVLGRSKSNQPWIIFCFLLTRWLCLPCFYISLAYAEMRLILARIIWNFDLSLADRDEKWMDNNEVYTLWEKAPLMVYLSPRKME